MGKKYKVLVNSILLSPNKYKKGEIVFANGKHTKSLEKLLKQKHVELVVETAPK